MITRQLIALLMVTITFAPEAGAAGADRGRLLYDNFCYHCHISEIHYRAGSDADSWAKLLRIVEIWQAEMGLGWGADDIRDVARWLDHTYYRLPDAPRTK